MQLDEKTHRKIMEEGKNVFVMLENYDKTREWPIGRARIDITLDKKVIKKLKEMKEKTGKSVSRLVEEAVLKC
jgi:hypothetical protein